MELAQLLALILGPTGGAWLAVKVSLNGQATRLKRVEDKVDKIDERVHQNGLEIARLQEH